ncbi:MAG: LptE family protein [Bacteroidota bacterium]
MTWTKRSQWIMYLGVAFCLHSCAIYSFSGASLSADVKTFSIADFQSNVALGPPDLAEQFAEALGKELLQRTALSQVESKGDIQFEGTIIQFEYKPIAPTAITKTATKKEDQASRTRLTITVQLNYINPKDPETAFSKKKFSQYEDVDADVSTDDAEPDLVKKIFEKLIKDIFNASVASW